jgi:hypothetical protein
MPTRSPEAPANELPGPPCNLELTLVSAVAGQCPLRVELEPSLRAAKAGLGIHDGRAERRASADHRLQGSQTGEEPKASEVPGRPGSAQVAHLGLIAARASG